MKSDSFAGGKVPTEYFGLLTRHVIGKKLLLDRLSLELFYGRHFEHSTFNLVPFQSAKPRVIFNLSRSINAQSFRRIRTQ